MMDKWQCTRCEYIYDPFIGDPDNGVQGDTSFEDLPKDWICPDCGAKKSKFQPYEELEENWEEEER
jgi:rubredoxin